MLSYSVLYSFKNRLKFAQSFCNNLLNIKTYSCFRLFKSKGQNHHCGQNKTCLGAIMRGKYYLAIIQKTLNDLGLTKLKQIFSCDSILLTIGPLINFNSFWYDFSMQFLVSYLNSTSLRSLLFRKHLWAKRSRSGFGQSLKLRYFLTSQR